MNAFSFPEANVNLAENQEEYQTLPAYYGVIGSQPEHLGYVVCFALTEDDINIINETKKIWLSQLTFKEKFNPVLFMVQSPFEDPKEYEKSTFDKSDLVMFGNMLLSDITKRKKLYGAEFNQVHHADLMKYIESIENE